MIIYTIVFFESIDTSLLKTNVNVHQQSPFDIIRLDQIIIKFFFKKYGRDIEANIIMKITIS